MADYIETVLELPYKAIEISEWDKRFTLYFTGFKAGQDEYSVHRGGAACDFEIEYESQGIKSRFGIDITVGNLYYFYVDLDNAYDILSEYNSKAVLKNYGETLDRSTLTIEYDKLGHCHARGAFKSKEDNYMCGVSFEFDIDQTYIPDLLISMDRFFDEIRRIQGHGEFY